MNGQNRHTEFFLGALAGGAIATLTALLFTTKRGQDLRSKVADACLDVEDAIKDTFSSEKQENEEENSSGRHSKSKK